jgi:hypothetical protein
VYAALIPLDLLGLDEPLGDIVWSSLNNAATLGVYVAVGIAILRYRLYQIDIINRTLVYVSLTVMLVLSYLGGVVVLQTLFRALTEQGSQLAIVASTLAIAAIFNPLRRRVQAFVDRLFYRRKYDAAKTLEALATRLRDETDLETLKRDLVGVVSETVLPAHTRLWLREAKEERWDEMREN